MTEHATDEFATDGGQLTQRQQRQAEKLQLKHVAEQGREQRLQTALETGEVGKQGQRIWIIPEFEPDEAEVDAAAKDLSVLEEIVEGRSEDGGVATEEAGR